MPRRWRWFKAGPFNGIWYKCRSRQKFSQPEPTNIDFVSGDIKNVFAQRCCLHHDTNSDDELRN
jgi:hypothetical protein